MPRTFVMPNGEIAWLADDATDYDVERYIRRMAPPKDRDFVQAPSYGNVAMDRMMKYLEDNDQSPATREMMTEALRAYNKEAQRKDIPPKYNGPPKRIIF